MKYYISDTHLLHDNIIKLCNRPYDNMNIMIEDIIRKWNKKISAEDEVYILGDFSWYSKSEDTEKLFKSLSGKKFFILGNHDSDLNRSTSLVWIKQYAEIKDNGRKVILFHYPIEDWNGKYHGSYHLYGHIHNNIGSITKELPNRFNVGVDVNNFEPMTLDELIERNKGR